MDAVNLVPDFREQFPELDEAVTNAEIVRSGKVADEMVKGTAMQYLYAVAHLTQAAEADLTGDTTSIKIGNISRNVKTVSKHAHDVFWSTTHYGRMYLTLVRQSPETGIGVIAVL